MFSSYKRQHKHHKRTETVIFTFCGSATTDFKPKVFRTASESVDTSIWSLATIFVPKELRSPFHVMWLTFFLLKEHSKGTWALKSDSRRSQRTHEEHLKGNSKALQGYMNTQGIPALENLRRLRTWRELEHLKHILVISHSGTWVLGYSGTQTLWNLALEVLHALYCKKKYDEVISKRDYKTEKVFTGSRITILRQMHLHFIFSSQYLNQLRWK